MGGFDSSQPAQRDESESPLRQRRGDLARSNMYGARSAACQKYDSGQAPGARALWVCGCDRGNLRVGDYLFFLRESDCTHARIDSIQVNDINYNSVKIEHEGFDVGIQTSLKVPRAARVLKVGDSM